MARTAVVATTATVAVKATSNMMGGGQKKQAEAAQNSRSRSCRGNRTFRLSSRPQRSRGGGGGSRLRPAAPAGGGLDDQLVQIQKLSVLKEQGLLTDEEFAAKKAQILGI